MSEVQSIDPHTGQVVEVIAPETDTERLEALCRTATAAAGPLERPCCKTMVTHGAAHGPWRDARGGAFG